MTWLLAGIIPPILWALVNHTDKYLLSKAKHHSSVNVLMVYSTAFSLVVLPIVYFFTQHKLFVSGLQVGVQIIGGILLTLSIYFYLVALNKDEASVVVPLFLLVPVFGYIFSYFLLGEVLTIKQIIACLLIVAGALVLSLEFEEERKMKIKHGVLWAMFLCTGFQAAQETLFKFVTIENSFAVSLFWLHVGITIAGGFLLIMKGRSLWNEFGSSVRENGKLMFGINFFSEGLSSVAYIIRDYATLLAPVTIVMTLNGYQPLFVFILGIFLSICFPKFAKEKIGFRHLLHKGLGILVIILGTMLIIQTM